MFRNLRRVLPQHCCLRFEESSKREIMPFKEGRYNVFGLFMRFNSMILGNQKFPTNVFSWQRYVKYSVTCRGKNKKWRKFLVRLRTALSDDSAL